MATEIDDGKLIGCVRGFPTIYDKNHGDYRNKHAKSNAWISIGRMMGVSEDLCEQRWTVLRNRYATELRNRKKDSPIKPGSSWRHLRTLSFLEEYILPRRTRSSMLPSTDKTFTAPAIKSEFIEPPTAAPEGLVTLELRSSSPGNATAGTTRLRPIAPRPVVSTVARLVPISNSSDSVTNSFTYSSRHSDYKDNQEAEDEDILFGKSIGHTLKNISNKKMKLQIKSEILSILAQHAD